MDCNKEEEIIKRSRGRPTKTIEEKREKRRVYMRRYTTIRYQLDDDYRTMKIEKSKEYHSRIKKD